MKKQYVKPFVKTVDASEIVDSMGPVSCGSGAGQDPFPAPGAVGDAGSPGGYKNLE